MDEAGSRLESGFRGPRAATRQDDTVILTAQDLSALRGAAPPPPAAPAPIHRPLAPPPSPAAQMSPVVVVALAVIVSLMALSIVLGVVFLR